MRLSLICWRILLALLGPALVSTGILYLYPAVLACNFPSPPSASLQHGCNNSSPGIAPFRLLVLADPQLEGDTSLPDPHAPLFPSVQHFVSNFNNHSSTFHDTYDLLTSLVTHDIPILLYSARKRLDLLGNDYYLAHIYRTLHWYTKPSHVTVLGDLLGSQWIPDDEFEYRGWRYWNRVFRHGKRVADEITHDVPRGRREVLGADENWNRRIINIAGNHDVGYAGDFSEQRLERFEKAFGRANWDITFTLPASITSTKRTASTSSSVEEHENIIAAPSIRLLILNNMNLDGPALSSSLQQQTYSLINDQFIAHAASVGDTTTFTILLTHVPLHKAKGVCVDAPFFSYFPPPSHEVSEEKETIMSLGSNQAESQAEEGSIVDAFQADERPSGEKAEGEGQDIIVANEVERAITEGIADGMTEETFLHGEQTSPEQAEQSDQKDMHSNERESGRQLAGDIHEMVNDNEVHRLEAVGSEPDAAETEEAVNTVEITSETEPGRAASSMQDYHTPVTSGPLDDREADLPAQQGEDTTSNTEILSKTQDDHNADQLTETANIPTTSPTSSQEPTNKHTTYHAILPHGVREQNHLSIDSTSNILQGIFGMSATSGRKGLILTGHDHEGCDVVHHPSKPHDASTDTLSEDSVENIGAGEEEVQWTATRTSDFSPFSKNSPHLREITLRSMMGAYSGNAGLLSLWYDHERGQWEYGFQNCALGVQHWWWAVHVLDLVVVIVAIVGIVARVVEKDGEVASVSSAAIEGGKAEAKKVEVQDR